MRKILALLLIMSLCLCFLSSCGIGYEDNTWFSDRKLKKCLVPELPEYTDNMVLFNNSRAYLNMSDEDLSKYLQSVYDYLKAQNFKYLGTKGEMASSNIFLPILGTYYYFEPSEDRGDFLYGRHYYYFVYSDGRVNAFGKVIFYELVISSNSLRDERELFYNNFTYNTYISLYKHSSTYFDERYILKE